MAFAFTALLCELRKVLLTLRLSITIIVVNYQLLHRNHHNESLFVVAQETRVRQGLGFFMIYDVPSNPPPPVHRLRGRVNLEFGIPLAWWTEVSRRAGIQSLLKGRHCTFMVLKIHSSS